MKCANWPEHVHDRAGSNVVVNPGRHQTVRVSFDGDVECPGCRRCAGDRVAAADGFVVWTMHGEINIEILTRSECQRGAVQPAKDKGHHIAGFGDRLNAFSEELLRVPRI